MFSFNKTKDLYSTIQILDKTYTILFIDLVNDY
jgi:hypothetical protein